MTAPAAAACQNHPEREAIGICVECRARICSECVTKVDGINYCVACYAALAERGARRRASEGRASSTWVAALAALGLLLVTTLLTWGLLEAALPGGS
ncbi:MAG: B-box zinc finger protein [Myxococcota bacterium]|nr:B-box zinc finger protein [Myxococcota bacterium]